jgi:Dolichyl-phosphate-mannose-protein mannosyltransferase
VEAHAHPAPTERRLTRPAVSAAAAVLVAAAAVVVVVAFQPIGSPWWIDASPDASYTASGIGLMAGQHTSYLGQPGMPLQDLMAITMETRYVAHKLTNEHETQVMYASQRLLHLGDSRIFFRGFAVLFFLFAAALAFVVPWRLSGSPWWGTAGALLLVCAPGLAAASIRFAPDTLLAGLLLAVGWLIVRGAEARSAWLYALAALLLGLSATVKVQALGLVVPLGLALILRPPRRSVAGDAGRWLRRHRRPLVAFLAVWVVFCATFDADRLPFGMSREQTVALGVVAGGPLVYAAFVSVLASIPPLRRAVRGPLGPVGPLLTAAFAAGALFPGTLAMNDLPAMLVSMGRALRRGGVDALAPGVSGSWSELVHAPDLLAMILLAVAGVAAVVGLAAREAQPLIWFSGSAATFVMATSHLGPATNFAPAFVLSIPPVLWLARRLPRPLPPVVTLAVVALTLVPTVRDLSTARDAARRQERRWTAMSAVADKLITKPGTIALTDADAPGPDVQWQNDVQQLASWMPFDYPYRFLPDSQAALDTAGRDHLLPTYDIGSLPIGLQKTTSTPLQFGTYELKPVPSETFLGSEVGTARLLSGPGVTTPYNHPDARYDPATGDYVDASGHYWDVYGDAVPNPPKRSNG